MTFKFTEHNLTSGTNRTFFYKDNSGANTYLTNTGTNLSHPNGFTQGELDLADGKQTILEAKNGVIDYLRVSCLSALKTYDIWATIDGVQESITGSSISASYNHIYLFPYIYSTACYTVPVRFHTFKLEAEVKTGAQAMRFYYRYKAEEFVSAWI